jgi:hypothetical protein
MKNYRPEHDKEFSTYGWRILMRPEEDYRRLKEGRLIIDGFSKVKGTIEEPEKGRLLNQCIQRLANYGYIKKADGIIIYKGCPFVNKMFLWEESIITFVKKNGIFVLKYRSELLTYNQISYVENVIFQEVKTQIQTLKLV